MYLDCGRGPCGNRRRPPKARYRSLWMHGSIEEHVGAATLERYSLGEFGPAALEAVVESHLLICAACRDRLAAIEPFNKVHFTLDGPIYSRITQIQDRSFAARHWGRQMEGGRRFQDLPTACQYLFDSFAQMFPEHTCGEACSGPATPSMENHA